MNERLALRYTRPYLLDISRYRPPQDVKARLYRRRGGRHFLRFVYYVELDLTLPLRRLPSLYVTIFGRFVAGQVVVQKEVVSN